MTAKARGRYWLIAGAVLALAIAIGAGFALVPANQGSGDGASYGEAAIGGPFSLVDHTGERRTEEDFRGQYLLVYIGYTFCPDFCPIGLTTISNAMDQLGAEAGEQVTPIFISIDPKRDTVEAMADYVSLFHEDMVGLTGTPEETAAAAKVYRAYYAFPEGQESDAYVVDHSTFIYLMGPDGRYLAHFAHNEDPARIAEQIEAYMAGS
ncbi:MAG: SCO family protein [Geminicoccaceae bacterium]